MQAQTPVGLSTGGDVLCDSDAVEFDGDVLGDSDGDVVSDGDVDGDSDSLIMSNTSS